MKKYALLTIGITVAALFTVGCATLPINEKEAAENAREQAKRTDAPRYSSDVYNNGINLLKEAEENFKTETGGTIDRMEKERVKAGKKKFTPEERKKMDVGFFNAKWGKAKKLYEKARDAFIRAIRQAYPNKRKDIKRTIQKEKVEMEQLKAEQAVPRRYTKAMNKYKDAQKTYKNAKKEYNKADEKEKADKLAEVVEAIDELKAAQKSLKRVNKEARRKKEMAEKALKRSDGSLQGVQ